VVEHHGRARAGEIEREEEGEGLEEEKDWRSEKRWSRLLFECLEQDRTGVGKKGVRGRKSVCLSPLSSRVMRAREDPIMVRMV